MLRLLTSDDFREVARGASKGRGTDMARLLRGGIVITVPPERNEMSVVGVEPRLTAGDEVKQDDAEVRKTTVVSLPTHRSHPAAANRARKRSNQFSCRTMTTVPNMGPAMVRLPTPAAK